MDSQKISNWIQLLTVVAVLSGLTLVVYELRQAKELAQVQIVSESFTRGAALELAKMGEDPRSALFKAEFRPQDLTEDDAVTLDGFYTFVTATWWEMQLSDQIAGMDRRWRQNIAAGSKVIFASEPAKRWFEVQEDQLSPEVSRIIRGVIDESSSGSIQKDRYSGTGD